jgi:type I restriction enzyme, S subunit
MKQDWEIKQLGDVCGFQNGFAFKSKTFKETGFPVLRISNIQKDKIDLNKIVFIDPSDYREDLSKYKVEKNDLLIAMSGATTGKIGFNQTDDIFYLNQRVGKFEPTKDLDKSYLYYYLSTKIEESLKISAGSAQPNLSTQQIKSFGLPFPPLDEQKRIVAKLDKCFEAIDKARVNVEKNLNNAKELFLSSVNLAVSGKLLPQNPADEPANLQLKQIIKQRQSLWQEAEKEKIAFAPDRAKPGKYKEPIPARFNELPNLPSNWAWASLDELTYFIVDNRGKTPPTADSGIPIISAANVRNGYINLSPVRFVSNKTYSKWSVRGEPHGGDILITTEAPVGRTAIYPQNEKYLLTRRLLGARVNGCNAKYVRFALSTWVSALHIAFNSRGATVPRILKPKLFATPLPLPPLSEQRRIVSYLDKLKSQTQTLESNYQQELDALDELKKSILQKAFNGEL